MRKIKIRTPKSLRIPKNTPLIICPDATTYYINYAMAQERAERRQFWEDVWEGLGRIGNADEVAT